MNTETFISQSSIGFALWGALCALAWCALCVHSTHASSQRTSVAVCALALAAAWGLVLATNLPADGAQLAIAGMVATMSISSTVDRARPSSLVLFAALTVALCFAFEPLIGASLAHYNASLGLYVSLIFACVAQLVVLFRLPLSPHRFTKTGTRKWPQSPSLLRDGVLTLFITLAFMLLLAEWLGINMAIFAFTCIMAGLVAALAALTAAWQCKAAFAVNACVVAFPAGMLAIALLPSAGVAPTLLHIVTVAAIAGAATVWVREALMALRIDDASDVIARFVAPMVIGVLAPAFLNLALLAPSIQTLGFVLIAGVLAGIAARGVCQFITGLEISSRAEAEGLDAKYVAAEGMSGGAMR